jgi:hypothetical protein
VPRKKCENLSLYFENGGPWEIVGSRTTFRKVDIDLEDGSSDYGIHTKILYTIWKYGEVIMLDGLTLHCSSSELFQIVKKKEMIILILPSHTKTVLQPFGRENVDLFKISL